MVLRKPLRTEGNERLEGKKQQKEEKVLEIDQVRARAMAEPVVFHYNELHRCSTIISTRVETIIFSCALTIEREINGSANP
jgi:hypothetical protein